MLLIWLTVKYYETNNYEFLMVVYSFGSFNLKCSFVTNQMFQFNIYFCLFLRGNIISLKYKMKSFESSLDIQAKQYNASIWPSVGHFNRALKKWWSTKKIQWKL